MYTIKQKRNSGNQVNPVPMSTRKEVMKGGECNEYNVISGTFGNRDSRCELYWPCRIYAAERICRPVELGRNTIPSLAPLLLQRLRRLHPRPLDPLLFSL
jgi:hypothetical protein